MAGHRSEQMNILESGSIVNYMWSAILDNIGVTRLRYDIQSSKSE